MEETPHLPQVPAHNDGQYSFSEADLLFMADFEDTPGVITSGVEAGKYMYAIKKLKEKQDALKQLKKEYDDFFKQKHEQLDKTITLLLTKIEGYATSIGVENLVTPNGTGYWRKAETWSYPEEETLVAFAKEHGLEVKVKEAVSKTDIKNFCKNHIQEHETLPEGIDVEITETRKFYVR